MEELLAMQCAATLTNSVLEGVGQLTLADYPFTVNADGTVTVSPTANAKAKNWVVWETFRTFYNAMIAADADTKDWPPPVGTQGGVGGTLSGTLGALSPLLSAIGPAAPSILQAIQGLISTAKTVAPAVPANVPALPK